MLEPIVAFFDKLIENFSWRRLTFLLAVLFLAGISLWAYEAYTSTFRLARIERQAALIEKMAAISSNSAVDSQQELRHSAVNLGKQLLATTQSDTGQYEVPSWGKKALSAAAAWLIFALFILLIPSTYSTTSASSAFMGMVVVAAPFVALAAALPTFEDPWLNYLAYPIGHIALLVVLILWLQRWLRRRMLAKLAERAP